MNKAILMGRLTRDPEIRYAQGDSSLAIAKFTLAVDRRFKKAGEQEADFIGCTSFGKTAEIIEKYCRQGSKIAVVGRIQTGSYTNKENQKVYTTDVIVEEFEFAESKASAEANNQRSNTGVQNSSNDENFMNIPEGVEDQIPF